MFVSLVYIASIEREEVMTGVISIEREEAVAALCLEAA